MFGLPAGRDGPSLGSYPRSPSVRLRLPHPVDPAAVTDSIGTMTNRLIRDMRRTEQLLRSRPRERQLVTPCCGVRPLPMVKATHPCRCGRVYTRLADLAVEGKS
jgi:hypothetical protein